MNTNSNPFATTLRAFNGDASLKAKLLAEVEMHRAADALIHGSYSEIGNNAVGFRGCAVGCTLHSAVRAGILSKSIGYSEHKRYEEIGIPRPLARLEHSLFETMPSENAQEWPGRFLSCIPVGADLSPVLPRLFVWLLTDEEEGVLRFAQTDDQRKAIQGVGDLYAAALRGETITQEQWQAAAGAAAGAAAYAAAGAAAGAAAAYAAGAAAYAAGAAAYAAGAAAYAAGAAAYAARQKFALRVSEKLIELMGDAPVPDPFGEERVIAEVAA